MDEPSKSAIAPPVSPVRLELKTTLRESVERVS